MKSMIERMFSRPKRDDKGDRHGTHAAEWELRPGGMVVQKRNSDQNSDAISTIKVKVKYRSSYHEIRINSHASFGELKKLLAEPTGLHPEEQKLIFKNRERDSKSYLDIVRVKDGSKLVLVEDIASIEKRRLEKLKTENKTLKSLIDINLEIEKFAKQVAALETIASGGGIVAEMDVENLTENLMRILIKLDEIVAEGYLKLQRREQVRRVQKQIETLDMLKMPKPNSISLRREGNTTFEKQVISSIQKLRKLQKAEQTQKDTAEQMHKQQQQQPLRRDESVVVTTKWETFD